MCQIKRVFHFEQQKSCFVPNLIVFFDVTAQYYVSGVGFVEEFFFFYPEMAPELFVLIYFTFVLSYVKFVNFTLGFVNDFLYFLFPIVVIDLICTLELEYSLLTSDPKENQKLNVLKLRFYAHLLKIQNTSWWLFILEILLVFVILQSIIG